MIQLVPHMRILVAVEPTDFRRGIDGLAAVCRQRLDADPFSGTVFVFTNRARTAIKILVYDGDAFWLCLRRLSRGRLSWWPQSSGAPAERLAAQELAVLLYNGRPEEARFPEAWRRITP